MKIKAKGKLKQFKYLAEVNRHSNCEHLITPPDPFLDGKARRMEVKFICTVTQLAVHSTSGPRLLIVIFCLIFRRKTSKD